MAREQCTEIHIGYTLSNVNYCLLVMILILRVGYKNNSCIRETQENSMEIPLQSSLPYILLLVVRAHYCASYPKWPCVEHEVNMCCPCCMTSLVPEPSTSFSQVLWSVLWLHYQIVTDVIAWPINPNPSCSKNRKHKIKLNKKLNKIKEKEKIKLK